MNRFVWLVAGLLAGCMPNQKHTETFATVNAPQNQPALVAAGQPTMPPGYFPASFAETTVACNPGAGAKPQTVLSDFRNAWYSEHLSAANEPSIYEAAKGLTSSEGRILRFTLLPTFTRPIFVRIDSTASQPPRLVATELTGAGGYEPGNIGRRIDRNLTEAEHKKIDALLSHSRIFELPPVDCELGLDGSRWIVEAADKTGYRFIDRWSPQSGPVPEVGMALLALTGWK
ncbi:MAG TPA: hypothetical protein VIQ53_25785 [Inquilinus sp.]|uniref:hypothetical protein n=1 Tax=Inquilinus sp. TaxID=1932117 RepID=UPI002F972648